MVGPMSPAARLKKSDDLGLGSQHLSTRAKWRLGKVKSAIRRGVAQIRLTPGIVVRDRMTVWTFRAFDCGEDIGMFTIDHLGIAVKSLAAAKAIYEKLGLTATAEEVVE